MCLQSRFVFSLTGLLLGLAAFFSVWFLAGCGEIVSPKDQTESFLSESRNANKRVSGLPKPGTYRLEKIFQVPTYKVLDAKGKLQPLSNYTQGKLTLLTFFYQRCSDANGCPYAIGVFHSVKDNLEKYKMSQAVRLVNISFDPERDTPMMMAGLEKQMSGTEEPGDKVEWKFLTTNSVNHLLPLINSFGQNVDIELDPKTGDKTLTYQHVLKVFLIDEQGAVREIYSTSYLDAEVLLNDIKTLLLEKR